MFWSTSLSAILTFFFLKESAALSFCANDGKVLLTGRRDALRSLVGTGCFWGMKAGSAKGATPTSPAEAIRRSASNVPGYGETDVFFPLVMMGKWKVTREEVMPTERTLEYTIRFLQSVDDNAVVADRGFNQASLEEASLSSSSSSSVRSYEWTETNPNDLRLLLEDGTRKEIKVTKRATERTEDTVTSSEFLRVTTEDAVRGIPSIQAQRVLSKWKLVSDTTVEGIQVVYDAGGSLGDPLAAVPGAKPTGPQLVSKARLHLEKIK